VGRKSEAKEEKWGAERGDRELAKSESGHGIDLLVWNVNCLRFFGGKNDTLRICNIPSSRTAWWDS